MAGPTHEFRSLTIAEVRQETSDAISVAFAVPADLRDAFRFQPGQHLAFRVMFEGEEVRRTYSICSGPGERDLRIAVKRVDGGRFSNWANDTLRAGATLDVMPPAGRFVVPAGDGGPRHLAAFAAGAGITPIIAMVWHVLEHEPESRFTLFLGNRTPQSILFREALEDLKDRHLSRFTLINVLSRGDDDSPLLSGRLDKDKIEALARGLLPLDSVQHVFLCGPGSMIKEARTALFGLGVPRERVHHEFFAAGGGAYQHKPTAPVVPTVVEGGAEVAVLLDGARHSFVVAPGERVVDAALKAGVRVPYACKGGMCCTCRAKLLEGEVVMDANYSLEPWETEAGFVLTCQARPTTPKVRLDYDAM